MSGRGVCHDDAYYGLQVEVKETSAKSMRPTVYAPDSTFIYLPANELPAKLHLHLKSILFFWLFSDWHAFYGGVLVSGPFFLFFLLCLCAAPAAVN